MLWKKESQQPDAFYVNILTPNFDYWAYRLNLLLSSVDEEPRVEKSNAIALQKRNEGNVKFRARKWLDAMELYGDSLRFAEPKSEHISLAYANRAACFLSLKMYENCLKDIELAKEAGYPKHLMPKLDKRKEECLKQMRDDPQPDRKLNFVPNDQFPYLANVAELRKSKNGEHSIVAKTDIDVGEIVLIEKPFQAFRFENFGSKCSMCLKEYSNLVACKNCADAMFCPGCQADRSLHDYECGLDVCGKGDVYNSTMPFVRGVLQLLKLFSNADDLMAFVEHSRNNPNELPADWMDERANYQILFNKENRKQLDETNQILLFSIYKTLMQIPHVHEMFQSTKHCRFLMHVIGHQMLSTDCISKTNGGKTVCRMSVIMNRYFKQSCNPNIYWIICGGGTFAYAVKPVKQGERFSACHVPKHIFLSAEARQTELLKSGFEKCACRRCNGKMCSPEQREQMENDPMHIFIRKNHPMTIITAIHHSLLDQLVDSCLDFFRKYGRSEWCDVFLTVINVLEYLSKVRFGSGMDFGHPLARAIFEKFFGEYNWRE